MRDVENIGSVNTNSSNIASAVAVLTNNDAHWGIPIMAVASSVITRKCHAEYSNFKIYFTCNSLL